MMSAQQDLGLSCHGGRANYDLQHHSDCVAALPSRKNGCPTLGSKVRRNYLPRPRLALGDRTMTMTRVLNRAFGETRLIVLPAWAQPPHPSRARRRLQNSGGKGGHVGRWRERMGGRESFQVSEVQRTMVASLTRVLSTAPLASVQLSIPTRVGP